MKIFIFRIIIIIILNFFFSLSLSFSQNTKSKIPNGVWIGNLTISGTTAHCSGTIKKITVKDSTITFKGSDINGVFNHSYDLKNPGSANKFIKIFNVSAEFLLTLSEDKNIFSLSLLKGCFGKANFQLNKVVDNESLKDKLFNTDNSKIPIGTWIGNFAITGEVHCNANIWEIIVEKSTITFKGMSIGGPIKHNFNIGGSKYQNKIIKINNVEAHFKLYLSKNRNTLTLKFKHGCHGQKEFKLITKKITKKIKVIEDMLNISNTICEEIGISETDQNYNKCILAILKSKGYEDIINDYSKICEEMEILNTEQKYIKCILTFFKNSPHLY